MSNLVPQHTKVSPESSEYRSKADFDLVKTLLKTDPLYNIPDHMRASIVRQAAGIMQGDSSAETQLSAARLLLECDKRNIDLLKIIMPKKIEQTTIKDRTTEELFEMVKNINIKMPGIIDAN